MAWPLWDMANDLAVARAGGGSETDDDPRYLRGRIATIVWMPGGALCLVAGAATGSVLIGLACFAVLIAGMWLFAFRPGATSAFLRRMLRRPGR
jgi:hypothetical protein